MREQDDESCKAGVASLDALHQSKHYQHRLQYEHWNAWVDKKDAKKQNLADNININPAVMTLLRTQK